MRPPWGFRGQLVLAGSESRELRLNQWRVYDPEVGQYVTAEPLAIEGMTPLMNTYGYAYSNPVNFVDPTGEIPPAVAIGLLIGFGTGLASDTSGDELSDPMFLLNTWGWISGGKIVEGVGRWIWTGSARKWALGAAGVTAFRVRSCLAPTTGLGAGAVLEGPTITLYHGGTLINGAVQSGRFSTTTSVSHATQYAAQGGGVVTKFEVPRRWLMQQQDLNRAREALDLLQGSAQAATEWRFVGEAARKLNAFRVP